MCKFWREKSLVINKNILCIWGEAHALVYKEWSHRLIPSLRELVGRASRAAVSEGCALPARYSGITAWGENGHFRSQWGLSYCSLVGVMGCWGNKGLVPSSQFCSCLEMSTSAEIKLVCQLEDQSAVSWYTCAAVLCLCYASSLSLCRASSGFLQFFPTYISGLSCVFLNPKFGENSSKLLLLFLEWWYHSTTSDLICPGWADCIQQASIECCFLFKWVKIYIHSEIIC